MAKNDKTTQDRLVISILEMRKVYSSLTDHEFAAMYQKRWGAKVFDIMRVLDSARGVSV